MSSVTKGRTPIVHGGKDVIIPLDSIICHDVAKPFPLPDECIDVVITSPPYWGLRDYGVKSIFGGDLNCNHKWVKEKTGLIHENRNFQEGTQEEVVGQKGTTWIRKYDEISAGFCETCRAWKGQLGLECISEDTELYTINGWKTIDTINLSDKILTFNLLNEKLYYHKPYKINKYDYNGDMFLIETKHTSQLVTPNHRIVVKYIADYKQWKGKKQYKDGRIGIERYWHFVEAKDLTPHDGIVLPLAGNFECENDELNISKHLNAVIGWIISEGHDGSKKGRNGYTIVQSLTVNRENVEQIRTDLNNANVKHTEHLRKDKRNKKEYVYFYIGKRSGWYQKIKNIIPNKEITPSLLNQPIENLKILYDRLMRGDGYKLKDYISEVFVQKRNTDTSDLFYILAVKIGKRAIEGKDIHKRNMRYIHTNDRNFTIIYPQYFNDSNFYIKNGKKQKRIYHRAFKKVDYNGRVWCPSVPNGAFVARRKGKVFITGNSHPQMYIDHLVMICREIKRVLKKTGSFYLNLGDSFYTKSGSGKIYGNLSKADDNYKVSSHRHEIRGKFKSNWLQSKQLLGIPWRVAIALQDEGFILRNSIIWHKPNPMPSSVKDRLNTTYEFVFHFVKNPRYYYDLDAIREPHKTSVENLERRINADRLGTTSTKKDLDALVGGPQFSTKGPRYEYQGKFKDVSPHFQSVSERKNYQRQILGVPHDLATCNPKGRNPGDVFRNKSVENIDGMRQSPEPNEPNAFHPLGRNPGDVIEYESKYKDGKHGQTVQGFIRDQSTAKERSQSREDAKKRFPGDPKKQQEYINFIHDHGGDPRGPNPGDVITAKYSGQDVNPSEGHIRRGKELHDGFPPGYNGHPFGKNPGDVICPESWGVDKNQEYHGNGKHNPKGQSPSDLKRNIVESFKDNPKGCNPGDVIKIGMHHGSSLTKGRATHYKGQVIEGHPDGHNPGDVVEYDLSKECGLPTAGPKARSNLPSQEQHREGNPIDPHPKGCNPGDVFRNKPVENIKGMRQAPEPNEPNAFHPSGKNPGDVIGGKFHVGDGYRQGMNRDENAFSIQLKNPPDPRVIVDYLQKHKGKRTYKKIDQLLGYDGDCSSHWFTHPESEHGFSYPSPEDWMMLKELLGFDDTFDQQMTETIMVPQTITAHPHGINPGDIIRDRDREVDWIKGKGGNESGIRSLSGSTYPYTKDKNPGDFFEICTQPFTGYNPELEHFAVFPEELLLKPLKSSCPRWVCKKCGHPRNRISKRNVSVEDAGLPQSERKEPYQQSKGISVKGGENHTKWLIENPIETIGWTDCGCKDFYCNNCKTFITHESLNNYHAIQEHPKKARMCNEILLSEERVLQKALPRGKTRDASQAFPAKKLSDLWKTILCSQDAKNLLKKMCCSTTDKRRETSRFSKRGAFSELQRGNNPQRGVQSDIGEWKGYDGTQMDNGTTSKTKTECLGRSPSQKWGKSGQQNREFRGCIEKEAQWNDCVPVLSKQFQYEVRCPFCNSINIGIKAQGFEPGVVLDPFCGRGTVGKVAKKLGLHYILFDIKPDYCELSHLFIGGQKYKVHKTQMKLDSFA